MITSGINFKNFKKESNNKKLKELFTSVISKKNDLLLSLTNSYKDSYNKKNLKKYKKHKNFRLIGMGGSTLGAQTIYQFLNNKIKKNFFFIDNLQIKQKKK